MRFKYLKEKLIYLFFLFSGLFAIIILAGIFVMLISNGVQTFKEVSIKNFFLSTNWNPNAYGEPSFGILSQLVSTLLVTLGSLVIAVPLGVGAAAFIADIASPRLREILKPAIEILAGIPSVVIGFLGIVLVGPAIAKAFGLSNGLNALNGCLLLAVMALPTIITISEDAIRAVPKSYKEASYAIGATRFITIIKITIPAASSGIITAIMLGAGRAVGETMTVLMATGNCGAMPHSLFDSVKTMTATIAIELGEVPFQTTHYYSLFAIGAILFLISLIINIIAEVIQMRHHKYRV